MLNKTDNQMKIDSMIEFLLANANPSIKLRVKEEVLGTISDDERKELLQQIYQEPNIVTILNAQKENGFIGNNLHGQSGKLGSGQFDNQETGIRYLTEKGIDKNEKVIQRSMESYTDPEVIKYWRFDKDDVYTMAAQGTNLIRCSGIARAKYDHLIDIQQMITVSLESFRRVLSLNSIYDILKEYKQRNLWLFQPNEKWPCQYHLMILAYTSSWRTVENKQMLADSITKIINTLPEQGIEVATWNNGYALGTLGAITNKFIYQYNEDAVHISWFERMEWLARLGVVSYIPELQKEISLLADSIEDGICNCEIDQRCFKGWGPYGGLQLEVDWKKKVRKQCDVTFRALMILYYSLFSQ